MTGYEKRVLREVVTAALANARTDGPEGWLAACPPPCVTLHDLSEAPPDHEEGPIFVCRAVVNNADRPTIGVVAYGRSNVVADSSERPLANRLSPPLAAMTFTAILSPEVDRTLAESLHNTPPTTPRVTVPLINNGERLYADVGNLEPAAIERAMLYLLQAD